MKTFTGLSVVLAYFELTISVCYGYYVNGYDDIQGQQPHQYVTQHYLSNLQATDVSKFPYHVIIVDSSKATTNPYNKPRIVCQGALINNNWIITSASCVWMNYRNLHPETTLAVIGTNDYLKNYHEGANTRKLSYPVFHPQFDTQTGRGNDLALWKLNSPIIDAGSGRVIDLVDQPRIPIQSNCEYTTNIDHTLYGNNAKLMTLTPCETFGVPDDIGYCVMMNNTLHENTKHFETGSPLVCGNKLYALRNVNGHFTTAFNSKPWVGQVINERQNYDRNVIPMKSTFERKNVSTLDYFRPTELSVAGVDKYINLNESKYFNSISCLPEIRSTRRLRRALSEIDLMFQSWAQSVSKMHPKRQIRIKIAISKIVTDGEAEEMEEIESEETDKEYDEIIKNHEAEMKKEEAKTRKESRRMLNSMMEEHKREYLRSHSSI